MNKLWLGQWYGILNLNFQGTFFFVVWKLIGGAYFCTEEKIKGVDMHTPYILMESKGSVKERKKRI